MSAAAIDHLKSLLSPDEIIPSGTDRYDEESSVWSANKHLKPTQIVRPKSIESLSNVLAYLNTTDLHFKVRSMGFGSASAKDVLISLTAFDEFEWDPKNEIVTLGAGQPWRNYYNKMEKVAPDYQVIAIRTPSIGVGGTVLAGGFSWLSGEYGCISDPANLLDAQVVKVDGSVVWASEEPELLWGLRGTQGALGVVTAFKFRAYKYTQSVWAGPILLPRESIPIVTKELGRMTQRHDQPKLAMFLYVLKKELLKFLGADKDMLVVHAFDALGEEHGRGPEGFKWALDIPGAIDQTTMKNLRGIAELQGQIELQKGKTSIYWAPIALPNLTEEIVKKSFAWWDNVASQKGSVADNGWLLFELKAVTDAVGDLSGSGWPRPKGTSHCLLLGSGVALDASAEEEALAQKLIKEGPYDVLGKDAKVDIFPNANEDWHEPDQMYGANYPKLQELKRKYDPKNKLGGPIIP